MSVPETRRSRRIRRTIAVAAIAALAAACGGGSGKTSAPTTTVAAEPAVLRVLVTNDDGVGGTGLGAIAHALRAVPRTEVEIVAPAENRSGSGSRTTPGTRSAHSATTVNGDPATAVDGYPADAVAYALANGDPAARPHLVVSGINEGQNLGVVIDASGTVGAARAAAKAGIPALAVSQGLGPAPDYPDGVRATLAWIAEHRAELIARGADGPATVTNLNIPTCPFGSPRPVVVVPPDPKENGIAVVDCATPFTNPRTDVEAFLHGYITRTDDLRPPKP